VRHQPHPPRCPESGKASYPTQGEALRVLKDISIRRSKEARNGSVKIPSRVYQCEYCDFWHMTSSVKYD
jgi:hypothetical protein